eukprot:jgi/Hompol1/3647/HPOL_000279-RA
MSSSRKVSAPHEPGAMSRARRESFEVAEKLEARKRKLVASSKRMLFELEELKYEKLLATLPKVSSYEELVPIQ